MNRRRWWLVALLSVLALVGAACGNDDDGGAVSDDDDKETTTTTAKPTFEAGTTMANLQAKGKIVVGTKFDQSGFGLKNPTSGEVEGFDVEIAKLVAQALFGGTVEEAKAKIEFTEAVSKNREPFIQQGTVDIVVATYTINDARKQVVDFAGPYFEAEQDVMVKADDTTIKSVTDLNGKKVCTAKGSTSEKNVRAQAPRAEVVLYDTYALCAEALGDGRVTAVTTDNAILQGFVKSSNGAYKLIGAPFSKEPYGIGLKKGDEAFRDFLNDTLEKIFENGEWGKAFDRTLGAAGLGLKTPPPPKVDRYTSTGSTGSTSSSSTATTARSGSGSGGTTSSTQRST
ncbi:MAG: glutamate ABC transporter substrate-binding protein, partial [Actinomycetota bacterium]|nr:glutamate ABC transporter substrate-binding protein [Actinomycetota bacterium]